MDLTQLATRDTPREVEREITRYGGLNPHGLPVWRVVLAQNVREQCFGQMRHMPRVSDDADITDIEPERYESGEFWIPRYMENGWILERWFPPHAWGSQSDWEAETSEDGITRLKGAWPRHGDYFMVGDGPFEHLPALDFWKEQIQKHLREMQNAPTDPAMHLSNHLYLERLREKLKREAFESEVDYVHRSVTDPLLATVGRTAQRVRNELMDEMGLGGHLAAG